MTHPWWTLMAALLAALLGAPAHAVERLAVLELSGDAVPADQRGTLTDEIRGAVVSALPDEIQVMTKENMEVMLMDMGIDADCIAEGACEVETARNLGVDYVVSGSVVSFGGVLVASLKIHETSGGRLLGSEQLEGADALTLLRGIGDTASVLVVAVSPEEEAPASDAVIAEVVTAPTTAPAPPPMAPGKLKNRDVKARLLLGPEPLSDKRIELLLAHNEAIWAAPPMVPEAERIEALAPLYGVADRVAEDDAALYELGEAVADVVHTESDPALVSKAIAVGEQYRVWHSPDAYALGTLIELEKPLAERYDNRRPSRMAAIGATATFIGPWPLILEAGGLNEIFWGEYDDPEMWVPCLTVSAAGIVTQFVALGIRNRRRKAITAKYTFAAE